MSEKPEVISTYNLTKVFKVKTKVEHVEKGLRGLLMNFPHRASFMAVDNVNFSVRKGEIFGLVGPNGSGKTTLLKMLCTVIVPTDGTAFVNGYNIQKDEGKVKASIGYADCSERSLYWRITGEQNLEFFARLSGMVPREFRPRIRDLLKLLGMEEDKAREKVMYYSHGMMQKIILARCLLKDPPILMLDEPTVGLDPLAAYELRELIKCLNREKEKTILISSHNMQEIERLCNRVAIMIGGKLLAIDVLKNYQRIFGALDKGAAFENAVLRYLGIDYSESGFSSNEKTEKDWSTFQFPSQEELRRPMNILIREALRLRGKIRISVEGDSMLPIMGNGQKIEVVSAAPESIEIGDIIFFEEGDHTKAHRVVNVRKRRNKLVFTTKGDAVFVEDKPLYEDNVIGKVINVVSGPQLNIHFKDLIRQTSEANGVNVEFPSGNLVVMHRTINTDVFEDFREVQMDDITKVMGMVKQRSPHVNLRLGKNVVRIESDIAFNESAEEFFKLRLDLWKKITQINHATADFINLLLKGYE